MAQAPTIKQMSAAAIPPNLNIDELISSHEHFRHVPSIEFSDVDNCDDPDEFAAIHHQHVVLGGLPLVIRGVHKKLDQNVFKPEWLLSNNISAKREIVRDLTRGEDVLMTVGHYVQSLKIFQKQLDRYGHRSYARQLMYLKDFECPKEWQAEVEAKIPPALFYQNSVSCPQGAMSSPGDLMSSLPNEMRALNLQAYIGHEGTFTPTHREMCGSVGHNVMVYASSEQKPDKQSSYKSSKGSSIWLMTEQKDRHVVAEYWKSFLKQDIEIENYLATLDDWKKAPFNVYIWEQKVGDLILVPAMAPHQVHNRGTLTIKVAWNRTTVDTLEIAMDEALASSRLICRSEQYKNKAIIYFSLFEYEKRLDQMIDKFDCGDISPEDEPLMQRRLHIMKEEFLRLFALFERILLDEMFSTSVPIPEEIEKVEFSGNITCSFCSGDIFNRFLTCKNCIIRDELSSPDAYDLCMDCYTMGRSCACVSKFQWAEQFSWEDLCAQYYAWRESTLSMRTTIQTDLPEDLEELRKRTGRKSLAEVCQEQLELRSAADGDEPKPKRVRKRLATPPDPEDKAALRAIIRARNSARAKIKTGECCHVCRMSHAPWKQMKCSRRRCRKNYCYNVLWRAFDTLPLHVMEDPNWVCPLCKKICNCSVCRVKPDMTPYVPERAVLGHKTLAMADSRSVECLVDMSVSNQYWQKAMQAAVLDDDETRDAKLQRLQAEAAKSVYHVDTQLLEPSRLVHAPQAPSTPVREHQTALDPALEFLQFSTGAPPCETTPLPIDPSLGGPIDPDLEASPYFSLPREPTTQPTELPAMSNDPTIDPSLQSTQPSVEATLALQLNQFLGHTTPQTHLSNTAQVNATEKHAFQVPEPSVADVTKKSRSTKRKRSRKTERVVSDVIAASTLPRSLPSVPYLSLATQSSPAVSPPADIHPTSNKASEGPYSSQTSVAGADYTDKEIELPERTKHASLDKSPVTTPQVAGSLSSGASRSNASKSTSETFGSNPRTQQAIPNSDSLTASWLEAAAMAPAPMARKAKKRSLISLDLDGSDEEGKTASSHKNTVYESDSDSSDAGMVIRAHHKLAALSSLQRDKGGSSKQPAKSQNKSRVKASRLSSPEDSLETSINHSTHAEDMEVNNTPPPEPKKRGRKRKHPLPPQASAPSPSTAIPVASSEVPAKRPRGRPRKNPLPDGSSAKAGSVPPSRSFTPINSRQTRSSLSVVHTPTGESFGQSAFKMDPKSISSPRNAPNAQPKSTRPNGSLQLSDYDDSSESAAEEEEPEEVEEPVVEVPVKRKRGRPPKAKKGPTAATTSSK